MGGWLGGSVGGRLAGWMKVEIRLTSALVRVALRLSLAKIIVGVNKRVILKKGKKRDKKGDHNRRRKVLRQ